MRLADHRNIVVLTGAGISQSAGLPAADELVPRWFGPPAATEEDAR